MRAVACLPKQALVKSRFANYAPGQMPRGNLVANTDLPGLNGPELHTAEVAGQVQSPLALSAWATTPR